MPQIPVKRDRNRRGFILIVHAAMLFFTILLVGLAVDAGTMYVIKGRLSSAVDAAALAAGRSVNLANTVSAAQTAATATATQFFNANFPNGYLGTGTVSAPTVQFAQELDANGNIDGVLNITVTASVPAPTYFMRALNALPGVTNFNSVNVSSTGTASRRSTVMMIVLDISSSMNTSPSPSACQVMAQAVQGFITNFSPFDTIGVVTFDYTARLLYAPSSNFLNGTLNGLLNTPAYGGTFACGNNTNTVSALELGYREIQSVNLPLAYNSIVLFTDGSPNGISAVFPIRTAVDTRWGPASLSPAPPVQSGSTYGQTNSCVNQGSNNGICVNMPVLTCTGITTITGTIAQEAGQNSYGGNTDGVFLPMSTDTAPAYPASGNCTYAAEHPQNPPASNAPVQGSSMMRQMIAYIPDHDIYGNSTHGVAATNFTTISPSICTTGKCNGLVSRDLWLYQVNNETSPDPTVNPASKNTGGLWANFPSIGSGSNFFTAAAGNAALINYFRPDQPNSIVAATMNATMAEAYRIRSDAATAPTTLFHPVINTIYLTGNGTDSVDREFLAIVANAQGIQALPYDPTYNSATNPILYANPAYQAHQESGLYLVTADKNALAGLFQKLAAEVLRLSN